MFNENKLYYMAQGSSVNSRLLYFIVLVFLYFFLSMWKDQQIVLVEQHLILQTQNDCILGR